MRDPALEACRQQLLVDDMRAILHNVHHVAWYRTVAATVPEDMIRKALSEIQHDDASEIGDPVTYFLQEMNRIARPAAPPELSGQDR